MTDVTTRTYDEEVAFVTEASPTKLIVAEGFVPNMRVPGEVYVNETLARPRAREGPGIRRR
jgi:hypothetical protein